MIFSGHLCWSRFIHYGVNSRPASGWRTIITTGYTCDSDRTIIYRHIGWWKQNDSREHKVTKLLQTSHKITEICENPSYHCRASRQSIALGDDGASSRKAIGPWRVAIVEIIFSTNFTLSRCWLTPSQPLCSKTEWVVLEIQI